MSHCLASAEAIVPVIRCKGTNYWGNRQRKGKLFLSTGLFFSENTRVSSKIVLVFFLQRTKKMREKLAVWGNLCTFVAKLPVMISTKNIKVVAFDADDTLWDCQGHFEVVMEQLYDELVPWTDRETAALELFATERKNMRLLGFGVKAFTLSILETAMRVSRNGLSSDVISRLLQACYTLLEFPCTPLPGVEETLQWLKAKTPYRLVVFTKGELLDQQHKMERSGLDRYFGHTEITSDKGEAEFRQLCLKLGVEPREMLMVGNSLKSDIAPALAVGCQAVYVPFHVTWQLEHADDIDHPHMEQIAHFAELKKIFCRNHS